MTLWIIGMSFVVCGLAGELTGRLARYQSDGMFALSYVPYEIDNFRSGHSVWAVIDAALFAFFAYRWWTGGGGDDTKRRLRSLRTRFTPSRRTAPQAA
ncbi:hypothetical protein [Streptomyces sp. NPDC001205]